MDEMLLHYFWKNRIFSKYRLRTADGRALVVANQGFAHKDAGPDFKQAVIKVEGITWVGDVEIHVNASDWLKHNHQHDAKYQSIILHVVYNNDVDIGINCPTLVLQEYISKSLIAEYERLSLSQEMLPCRNELPRLTTLQLSCWLSRLAVSRLERREKAFCEVLKSCRGSWQEAVFRCLVSNFGFRTNAPAFELLAKSLPYKVLLKHKDSRLQIYALLFGQAGFLDEEGGGDEYYTTLQAEYHYLRYKYSLSPIPLKVWNLLRMRPQNFPCIRIAQLCECLYRVPDLIELVISGDGVDSFYSLSGFEPHPYWKMHRHFGREDSIVEEQQLASAREQPGSNAGTGGAVSQHLPDRHSCTMGKSTVNLLIINTVVTTRFARASFHGDDLARERSIALLEQLPFERNAITREYASAGFPHASALESQALLELNRYFCTRKRCLHCDIGCSIIRRSEDSG